MIAGRHTACQARHLRQKLRRGDATGLRLFGGQGDPPAGGVTSRPDSPCGRAWPPRPCVSHRTGPNRHRDVSGPQVCETRGRTAARMVAWPISLQVVLPRPVYLVEVRTANPNDGEAHCG